MTEIEQRLRDALSAEAEARPFDLASGRRELDARLATSGRRRRLPVLATAAAVVLVVGAAAGVSVVNRSEHISEGPALSGSGGEVDADFACPSTEPVDLTGAQDAFVPDLQRWGGPAGVAEHYGAGRWTYQESGDTSTLRLGNDDGTLAGSAAYHQDGDTWALDSATVCSNAAPADDASSELLQLGAHDDDANPPTGELRVGDPAVQPVLVDDRPVYDAAGLVIHHRSIYAAPCRADLCLATGEPGSATVERLPMSRYDLHAYTGAELCTFIPDDDLAGRPQPLEVKVIWDPFGTSTQLRAAREPTERAPGNPTADDPWDLDGPHYSGTAFNDPSWGPGKFWVVLMPASDDYGIYDTLRTKTQAVSGSGGAGLGSCDLSAMSRPGRS